MIVTGREGGVRTQRRYGSVFKLIVDLNKSTYIYQELPHHISSRSVEYVVRCGKCGDWH